MIHTALRSGAEEVRLLERGLREEAAYVTEEELKIQKLLTKEELLHFLEEKKLADLICVDVSEAGGVGQAEQLRASYPQTLLVVLADLGMSPICYMKPSIMAASLLLKPLSEERIREVFRELLQSFAAPPDEGEVFLLETREEKQRIPYAQILYFEARAKKIYACTRDSEYGFYDTVDKLEERLGGRFIRCHRSYLVNAAEIAAVRLSAGILELRDKTQLPLSRSYKERIKELDL